MHPFSPILINPAGYLRILIFVVRFVGVRIRGGGNRGQAMFASESDTLATKIRRH
jgi:hypothetical protein